MSLEEVPKYGLLVLRMLAPAQGWEMGCKMSLDRALERRTGVIPAGDGSGDVRVVPTEVGALCPSSRSAWQRPNGWELSRSAALTSLRRP
jgi:hypothetical protein